MSVASDGSGYCALLISGEVYCWGYGKVGELGNGTFYTSSPHGRALPVAVEGVGGVGTLTGVTNLVGDGQRLLRPTRLGRSGLRSRIEASLRSVNVIAFSCRGSAVLLDADLQPCSRDTGSGLRRPRSISRRAESRSGLLDLLSVAPGAGSLVDSESLEVARAVVV